jgi:predicted ATPase
VAKDRTKFRGTSSDEDVGMTTNRESASAIRTPDQKLRVFVSSTLAELAEERAAVARAITSLHLSPVMFELGARPHPPQELYRAYLAQSDIFVGIYWQSYGWIGPDMQISGLEDEFRLSGTRPRLLYLKTPAPDRQAQLSAMIAEIQDQGTAAYRTFRTPRELGRLVRDDLAVLLSERFVASEPRSTDSSPMVDAATGRNRRSLPLTSTSLVGRAADVEAVVALLESPDVRLVTLSGAGGMGKTRLAIAVGEVFERRGPMRVLFIPLSTIADSSLVMPRIASAVGVIVEGVRSARDTLIDHFAEHPTLLILDNLEQVIDVAPDLDDLLTCCPGVKILATSRSVLRLRAENEYAVPPLAVDARPTELSIDDIIALPAVRLFADRATAVRHDFALTEENAPVVAEICRRLDGMPLAIELAAARVRLLPPSALLARLETVLDALGSGPVDLPERQRTLRATVQWSVGLLDDSEQRMLATLSVFADGWTVAAAAEVAGATEDETLDLLDSLAGHSLVSVDAVGSTPRFRMLTTVREFAGERLAASTERFAVERRHAQYFAALVEVDDLPGEQRIEWANRLRADEENLRGAIQWFFDNDVSRLPHVLRCLWLMWQLHDRMPEARTWVGELQRHTEPLDLDDTSRAEVLFTVAVTAVEVGDDSSALATVDEITELIPTIADPTLRSALQLALSWSLPIIDAFDDALAAALAARTGFIALRDAFTPFAALTVGMLQNALGRDAAARTFLTEADDLSARYGNPWLMSIARTQLSSLAARSGDHEEAQQLLLAVLDLLGNAEVGTLTACFTLIAFAELCVAEDDPERAAVALGAVDGLRERGGLLPWPNSRRSEAALRDRVAQMIGPATLAQARTAGTELRTRDALGFVRTSVSSPAAPPARGVGIGR